MKEQQKRKLRILILGFDGYIGWSLGLHQLAKGNEVCGVDNFSRRKNVEEMGSWSAISILPMSERLENLKKNYGEKIKFFEGDLLNSKFIDDVIRKFNPDAIVHLAEQPSAPFSMIDQEHTVYTQKNNVIGTLNVIHAMKEFSPKAHLVKLGTLGEYGTPDIDIAEGLARQMHYHGRYEKRKRRNIVEKLFSLP